jgi:predicted aspartyl protease
LSTRLDTSFNRTPRANALGVAFLLAACLGACIGKRRNTDSEVDGDRFVGLRLLQAHAAAPFVRVRSMSPHIEMTLCQSDKVITLIDTGSERGLWTFHPQRVVACSVPLPSEDDSALYVADRVMLGGLVLRNVEVSDAAAMPSNMQQADFAIGMALLSEFPAVAFDWKNSQFLIGKTTNDPQVASIDVFAMKRWRDDSPIVTIPIDIAEQRLEAAIDTGFTMDLAVGTTLYRSANLEKLVSTMRAIEMPTTRGMQSAQFGVLRVACVIGARAHDEVTLLVLPDDDSPDYEQYPVIIGAGLLRRYESLTLDFTHQRILVGPPRP